MISSKLFTENKYIEIWNEKSLENDFYQVSTDSRQYKPGQVFIAIKGERHDPFKYVEPVLSDMPLVVFEATDENLQLALKWSREFTKTIFLAVESSLLYVQNLARLHVKYWYDHSKVHHQIAIAGSNGKTTTKEMMSHIFHQVMPDNVISTRKNDNNHLGVPLTLFQIDPRKTQVAVVEFGSNHPGEMKVLCDLAHPNVGITTNIGHTHMEFFSSIDDVFKEETLIYHEIMQQTKSKGEFLINMDDPYLNTLERKINTKTFSTKNSQADYLYHMTSRSEVVIRSSKDSPIHLKNSHITGEHNFVNLANSVVLASILFPDLKVKFLAAAATFQPTTNRSQWIKFKDREVFLDAYNANPSSMEAALSSFIIDAKEQGIPVDKLLVVIGEMKELGQQSATYHEKMGEFARKLKVINLIYIGNYTSEFQRGFGQCHIFSDVDKAKNTFLELLPQTKKCFIKASRSLQLERLIDITKG